MLVSNDTNEAVVPGREVLWATVGLAEGFLWFQRRLCWRGFRVVGGAHCEWYFPAQAPG